MHKTGNILVVDDNLEVLDALKQLLKHDFETVKCLDNPNLIISELSLGQYDVILLDMNFSPGQRTGNEGIFWTSEILKFDADAIVILMTAYGEVDLAVKAIKNGGTDFLVKPWEPEKLITTIQAGMKLRWAKRDIKSLRVKEQILSEEIARNIDPFIAESENMQRINELIKKVAPTDANVLITGEHGTGKELVARQIHKYSNRSKSPFVQIDLGSVSETLFESELFGHKKGAFTDASEDRQGRIMMASGGSIFLDEISNISLRLQAKLLASIQNKSITPLGSNTSIKTDIRIICATNQDLQRMVQKELFREDLLYRINTIQIDIPPLRQRTEDIIFLAEYYKNKFCKQYRKESIAIPQQVYQKILDYPWPGNVRELKHTMEKAVILCEGSSFDPDIILLDKKISYAEDDYYDTSKSFALSKMEKKLIIDALDKSSGKINKAAALLEISRTTLYSKMKKHGL